MKQLNIVLFLLVVSILLTPIVFGEDQFNHVLIIQSPDLESDSYFGYSMVCNEDFIVVGEVWNKVEGKYHAGKAYIFNSDGSLKTSLQSPTPIIEGRFGYSVAVNGDVVVIGEPLAEIDGIKAGNVYVFDLEGNLKATFSSSNPVYLGRFGWQVAISGDKLVVSESGATFGEFSHAGKVNVYDFEGNLLSSLQSPEPFEGGGVGGNFGFSLACSDEIIVVGEVHTTVDDKLAAGRAFIYSIDGDFLASLQSPEPQTEGEFGQSVAVNSEVVVVGEHYADVEGISKAGEVHVFDLEGNLLYSLHSPQPEETALFGRKVTVSDDFIIVGERGADGETDDEGQVHLFDLSGNWVASFQAPNPSINGEFGSFVYVNGESLVVGERSAVLGEYKAGQVHVYRFGPAVEVHEPVEETTTETEEPEVETDTSSGILGFPIFFILAAIVIYYTSRKWL